MNIEELFPWKEGSVTPLPVEIPQLDNAKAVVTSDQDGRWRVTFEQLWQADRYEYFLSNAGLDREFMRLDREKSEVIFAQSPIRILENFLQPLWALKETTPEIEKDFSNWPAEPESSQRYLLGSVPVLLSREEDGRYRIQLDAAVFKAEPLYLAATRARLMAYGIGVVYVPKFNPLAGRGYADDLELTRFDEGKDYTIDEHTGDILLDDHPLYLIDSHVMEFRAARQQANSALPIVFRTAPLTALRDELLKTLEEYQIEYYQTGGPHYFLAATKRDEKIWLSLPFSGGCSEEVAVDTLIARGFKTVADLLEEHERDYVRCN